MSGELVEAKLYGFDLVKCANACLHIGNVKPLKLSLKVIDLVRDAFLSLGPGGCLIGGLFLGHEIEVKFTIRLSRWCLFDFLFLGFPLDDVLLSAAVDPLHL